jgi:dihydroorotase
MNVLIQKALILDPQQQGGAQQLDILVEDGIIRRLGENLSPDGAQTISSPNLMVSPGWVDIGVWNGDPGLEHREDLESLRLAGAKGGYTHLAVWPNSDPVVASKAEVAYLTQANGTSPVDIHPIGAISLGCAGKTITEMIDMQRAGALAFSDGIRPVQSSGLMLRALQYVRYFDGVVINQPLDYSMSPLGQMHEGPMSTSLGLTGIPSLAEEVMVNRDIQLARYTNSRLHLANLSTAGAVDLVRAAKREGVQVTASVAMLNLFMDDSALASFDTHVKVMPPLRSLEDQKALWQGLMDGTIDMISTNHVPVEIEHKQLEFPYAEFGAIGLETAFGLYGKRAPSEDTNRSTLRNWVNWVSMAPRNLLRLPVPQIREGQPADLTAFDPDLNWTVSEQGGASKSNNSPLIGQQLKGRVLGVCHNGQIVDSKG